LQPVPIRILVVNDFAPSRQTVSLMLATKPKLQVVGEASDGLEAVAAVAKAVELKPDLILLDIGMPEMNGIKAARQIRERVP
jgi:chemotaxis response regulator CheB